MLSVPRQKAGVLWAEEPSWTRTIAASINAYQYANCCSMSFLQSRAEVITPWLSQCVEWCEYLGQQATIGLSFLERLQRTTQHFQALSSHCCILLLDCPTQVSEYSVCLSNAIEVCSSSRTVCAVLWSSIVSSNNKQNPDSQKARNLFIITVQQVLLCEHDSNDNAHLGLTQQAHIVVPSLAQHTTGSQLMYCSWDLTMRWLHSQHAASTLPANAFKSHSQSPLTRRLRGPHFWVCSAASSTTSYTCKACTCQCHVVAECQAGSNCLLVDADK